MKKLSPVEKAKYINSNYKEYLKSSFKFDDKEIQSLFVEELDREKLYKGPYVDVNLPFQRGNSINELIKQGVVCRSFGEKLEDIDFNRPLYSHQEESIKHINSGRSAIITTGTGSGKTESFLYPILNELLMDVEKGNTDVGIRAIFLYPMNALVNDQINRIRRILKNCPEITYGFFTGDTVEKGADEERKKRSKEDGMDIPENELVTREEIRENPPHLLFTNYSMLEFLLIRPNDYSLFETERLANWKFVVLDEAHSYYGSLGIEISLLLRRLTGLAPQRPRFILTSATLGTQGKSEEEIVHFAKSLTSVLFEKKDIIFSKRILLEEQIKYTVNGNDYTIIKNSKLDYGRIKEVVERYLISNETTSRGLIYDLLVNDSNTHKLSEILRGGCKEFDVLKEEMNSLSEEELIDLIDIINMAEKNGVGLFDMKYHSFVRPLSGAYVTLGEKRKLSLSKTNEIDEHKAFEIGNCRFCNSPYIIGNIRKNKNDGLDYLLQNNEVDIYENYGDDELVKLDYFLLQKPDEDDKGIISYEVCSRCGVIRDLTDKKSKKCMCIENKIQSLYKVSQENEEDTIYNNIKQCPCCKHGSHSGVVKGLNIGKDEGTAIIAQILYEAMEGEEEQKIEKKKLLLRSKNRENTSNEGNAKQFLAFSDSRQQASFFAMFFGHNHERLLKKRLIWDAIVNEGYNTLTVEELVSIIGDKIEKNDLFYEKEKEGNRYEKKAWLAVLADLLKVDGAYDGEGLGLYHFDLDSEKLLKEFNKYDKEEIDELCNECQMSFEQLLTFVQIIAQEFKTVPAINYVKANISYDEKKEELGYRFYNNYVILKNPSREGNKENKTNNNVKGLLHSNGKENKLVRYTMKALGVSALEAQEVIETVFDVIFVNFGKEIGFTKEEKDGYQLMATHFVANNYKNTKYYMCDRCGRITPHNINDVCVQDKCLGKLNEVNPDEALASNYYRDKYKTKRIERIVIKEHTAQLKRETAKEYQNEFKNKDINILSCSTTFEMGIDIGGLETVMMRNVPPTPANYVQRAGRAGRRKESSAFILTYCDNKSHDYTYFSEPEKMISGIIEPPYFNVLNKRIIIRHLMAASLGFFFRSNKDLVKSLDEFVFSGNGYELFEEYINSYPQDLKEYIDNKILPEEIYSEYKNYNWIEEMGGKDEKLTNFIQTIKTTMEEYEVARDEAAKAISNGENKEKESKYYKEQIEHLRKEKVIDNLSNYCVIPKYGFPVDVVNLQIYDKNGVPSNKYDLSRDLKIAISEYAPDSEVVVDKEKYKSKYITFRKDAELQKNWFAICNNCDKVNISLTKTEDDHCKYCRESIVLSEYYIDPIYGFKTGVAETTSLRLKPKRSYSGEVLYVGNGKKDEKIVKIGNEIQIETTSDDELLVMNKSGFYVCAECGYSEIAKKHMGPMKRNGRNVHKNYKNIDCHCQQLDYLRLGHKFRTDVAKLVIPRLECGEDVSNYSAALSFMYAFLEGISEALGIERNDIDGLLEKNMEFNSYNVLIYDNVPGGAGHVKRLLSEDAILNSLEKALNKVRKECCDENSSCYSCLRNYYNQSYHKYLQRKLAIEVIDRIIFGIKDKNSEDMFGDSTNEKVCGIEMKLVLGNDGRNPSNESSEEIWNDIIDDCEEDDEMDFITLIKEKCPERISNPYYNKTIKIVETGESFFADLVWDTKKVLFFLNSSFEDYEVAKKTGWSAYCTKEKFNIEEFIRKVE